MSKTLMSKAFTLVEVTIALAVVALLATIIGVTYSGIVGKVRDNAIVSDANSIMSAEKALAFNENIPGRGWYSPVGKDFDLNVSLSAGNIADVNTNSNGYCIRVYNPTSTTYKTIATAYTLESTSGVCAATTPTVTSCPTGFILVPGSVTYGTNNFCVMKYEAKCANTATPTVGLTTPTSGYNTYLNTTTPCTSANGKTVVSVASGYPLTMVSQTDAMSATYSQNINGTSCSSCHLISEAEWMTIAQNVLTVASNWSGGAVGVGYMYLGHDDGVPWSALEADSNDANGYANTQSTSPSNQRRTLTLSNGQVIWDFSANVWEWTQGTAAAGSQPGVIGTNYYTEAQWPNVNYQGSLSVNPFPKGTGILGAEKWTTSQGIGQLHSNLNMASSRSAFRGGNWGAMWKSGVLQLDFSSPASSTYDSLGFRIAQ